MAPPRKPTREQRQRLINTQILEGNSTKQATRIHCTGGNEIKLVKCNYHDDLSLALGRLHQTDHYIDDNKAYQAPLNTLGPARAKQREGVIMTTPALRNRSRALAIQQRCVAVAGQQTLLVQTRRPKTGESLITCVRRCLSQVA